MIKTISLDNAKKVLGEEFTYDMFEKFITDGGLTKKYAKQALKYWLDKGFVYEFKPKRYKWIE